MQKAILFLSSKRSPLCDIIFSQFHHFMHDIYIFDDIPCLQRMIAPRIQKQFYSEDLSLFLYHIHIRPWIGISDKGHDIIRRKRKCRFNRRIPYLLYLEIIVSCILCQSNRSDALTAADQAAKLAKMSEEE